MAEGERPRGPAGWLTGLSPTSPQGLRGDTLAGLTVALVGLPQCLAYAMMSGLPPAYGLATAAVPGLVAALAGRSAQVVTGPTNTTGLLVLAALGPWLADSGLLAPEGLPVLATLCLLAGVLRLLAGFAGGAQLLRFLPESVLVGFTAGAGVLIAAMQIDEALGLPPVRAGSLAAELQGLGRHLADGHRPAPGAVAVTGVTVTLLVIGRSRLKRVPMALLVVVAATAVAWIAGLDASAGLPVVADRGTVPGGWPPGALPDLSPSLLGDLLVPAGAIALLGTLELTVSAHGGGGRPDMRREILAQGWANVAGAFSASFPASASLTRSALLRLGGARTRFAAALAAVVLVPIVFVGGPALAHIPQASLAAVLFVTAYGMVQRRSLVRMWRVSRETRILMVVTIVATLVLPLEWAIVLGAGLGLALHLAKTSTPRMEMLEPRGERFVPVQHGREPEAVVLEVSGNLHYAAVGPFMTQARGRIPRSARLVVIDLSHAHDLRYAAIHTFEDLADELAASGAELRLAGVPHEFCTALRRAGSRLHVTPAEREPGKSLRRCLAGESHDACSDEVLDELEEARQE